MGPMNKSVSGRSAIRQIACCPTPGAPWFATGEWERAVEVWSIPDRRLVSAFETVLDFGGRRLALADDPPIVIAGAYHRHGICGYDAITGEQLWERKDLRRVQTLEPLPGNRVAAGFSDKSLHLLSAATGETLTKIRGVAEMYSRAGHALGLGVGHSGAGWAGVYRLDTGKRLWKEDLASFTALHAAVGPEALVISEVGGPVRCFDHEGIEQWRWQPPRGEHVTRLVWSESLNRFCGVLHPYKTKRSPAALVTLDGAGSLESAVELADAMEYEFTPAGDALVVATLDEHQRSSAGEIVAIPDGRVIWRFREDVPRGA